MSTWSSTSLRSVPAKRSAKAFIIRRAYRRAHHAHPRRSENVSEPRAELRIMIADDHLRSAVHGGVPSLLRAPLVGRCIRDRSMEDRPATQVQEEEYKNLAEPNVEGLGEVAGPRDMVSKEGRPTLPVTWRSRAAHVSLNRSRADADA